METPAVKRLFPVLQQKPEAKAGEGLSRHRRVTSSWGQSTGRVKQPVTVTARRGLRALIQTQRHQRNQCVAGRRGRVSVGACVHLAGDTRAEASSPHPSYLQPGDHSRAVPLGKGCSFSARVFKQLVSCRKRNRVTSPSLSTS